MDKQQAGNGRDMREVVTQQTYDRVAQKYAHTRCGKGAWRKELDMFWQLLKKQGHGKKRILDLGCGTGRVLHHAIQHQMPIGQYIGVDYSGPMLDEALTWSAKLNVPFLYTRHDNLYFLEKKLQRLKRFFRKPQLDVHVVQQSMQEIDPPTSYFDAVTLIASLHHILNREDRETVMELCFHTLKPGGILFMTNWAPLNKDEASTVVNQTFSTTQKFDRFYYKAAQEEWEQLVLYAGLEPLSLEMPIVGGNMVTGAIKPIVPNNEKGI